MSAQEMAHEPMEEINKAFLIWEMESAKLEADKNRSA